MKVNCSYGYESFTAGGSAVALLTCDGVDIDSKITAQACGHVCIDTRWSGSTGVMANNFAQTSLYPVDASIQIPKLQTARDNVAFCIFLTPKIVFPLSFSKGEAILIYFDIPIDSLPTFRGLCAYISYAINLHVITTDGTTKQLSLPFTVKGCGCASVPYSIRCSNLSILSPTSPALALAQLSGDSNLLTESVHENVMAFDPIYNIIDKHFICTLQLIAPLNQGEQNWHPGTVLNARLNFEDSLQLCNKVQVRLIQCENHPNGSHIQEKIIGQCTRSTVDALLVCLSVTIPSESPCEFVSPVFTVIYKVEVDFHLADKADDPVTWSMPINIRSSFDSYMRTKSFAQEIAACQSPSMAFSAELDC